MKRTMMKMMTLLLLIVFIILAITGLWMRFGDKTHTIAEIHAISGMTCIVLVLYHWSLFLRMFFNMWKK